MTILDDVAARVAAVVGIIQATVRGLAGAAVVGIVAFVVGVGVADRWSGDALVFAGVVALAAAVAPFTLARFGSALAPVRALPEVSAAEVREAAGTLAVKLGSGERHFVEAKGLGRVTSLGRALWALRSDVEVLNQGGIAPASALFQTLRPTRLIRVGISALVAPFVLATGLLVLTLALVLT
jgi:hypothetical protein